ncbi:TPA: DUF5983 family protein [Escherichia coli]
MSRIITTTVYTLDELSCPAQEKARDGYRQHHADSNWYENVYEDFREVCGIFGIDLRQRVFRLSNGRFMEEPSIWFSGFCSQGDGACFEGRWHWQPATVRRIREYAPQEHELHRIADALQAVQKRNFWQLQAEISHRGRYCHPYSMDITVTRNSPTGQTMTYPVLRLKRLGLSKTFRRLVVTLIQRYGVSLIHLDASAECLPDLPTFGW